MKIKYVLLCVALLFVAYSSPASCQENIFLAGVNLHLGMTKEEISQKLDKNVYTLKALSNDKNSFGIVAKGADAENFEFLGTISFKDNKINFISKRWHYSDDSNSNKVGDILFYLLSEEIGKTGESTVKIKTMSSRDVDYELNSIEIILGSKTIVITVTKGDEKKFGNQISFFESLKK